MVRGMRKHLKRVKAPKSWMLDKLGGVFAPKPSSGPHKTRLALPLTLIIRNKLKYALNYKEVCKIVRQRVIKVDGRIRTDKTFPTGLMDIVSIEKTNENYRVLYDEKGRFVLVKVNPEEAKFKLLKVKKATMGSKKVPFIVTHDGRTIRFPDPLIKVNDTIKYDLKECKVVDFFKFEVGNLCLVTGGHNVGRVGVITSRDRHPGSFDIIHVKDSVGNEFATRMSNIFVIGKTKSEVTLPRARGIRRTIIEERTSRLVKRDDQFKEL